MARLRFCLLLAVLYSCSELGHGDKMPSTETITIVPQLLSSEVDSNVPKTTTSTTPPTTTTEPTTTPPTTTSSTTPATTTSSTTPPTTTSSTTPPTTPGPAPSPAPSPLPPPTQGTWWLKDEKNNVTCIAVQFAAQLNVTYIKAVENTTVVSNVLLNVPSTAVVVNGSCADDQWVTLAWSSSGNASLPNNTLTLVYHSNGTTRNYALKSLNVTLTPDNFVNRSSQEPMKLWHGSEWETPLATSYRCKTPTRLSMTSDTDGAALTLSQLQEEAYKTTPGHEFSAARECGGGDVPDAVPIAVGCALGGLVVVVLVAYLVGRRRSAARGYLSM